MSTDPAHPPEPPSSPPLWAVVIAPFPLAGFVVDELEAGLGDLVHVSVSADATEAVRALSANPAVGVAVVVLSSEVGDVDAAIDELDRSPPLREAPTLLLTDRAAHDDVSRAVDADRLEAFIAIPWTAGRLGRHAQSQVARWLHAHRPGDPRGATLVSSEGRPLELPASGLLRDLELTPDEVTHWLVGAIESVLGPRPRLRLPADVRLTHQDAGVDAVLVALDGRVALERRTPVGDLRLHHDSTGPVIGLLALAHQRRSYFTARTTTTVEVIHLSLEQLDRAVREEPEVGAALAAVSIRALAARLRRSEQLHIETIKLNRELDAERQRLSEALHQLEQARLELVEQARFATLGELAAGIAHELNNPVAALQRSASYVVEDLDRLLVGHPFGDAARELLATARERTRSSAADERAQRRALEEALGDRGLVRRLLAAGITDPAEARRLADGGADMLEVAEAAAGIGGAVHNLELASERIGELVASLRAYARPDRTPVDDVDLHEGLEDTLRLTAHRLRGIEVERSYGELPRIRCHPAQLDQVWTNLLVNAAEELDGDGRIEIITDTPDDQHVRVQVIDDGPGIEPDVLARVFEPRFTTKQGTIRYGLGLGLAIARRIVEQHGGQIGLDSTPGRTVATVQLPVTGPPEEPST